MILEWMDGGDLLSVLRDTTIDLTLNQKLEFCIQAATGLQYLHENDVIHRDLAERNCVVFITIIYKHLLVGLQNSKSQYFETHRFWSRQKCRLLSII